MAGILIWLLLMPLSSAFPNAEMVYWVIHRLLLPFTLCLTLVNRRFKAFHAAPVRMGLPELAMGILAALIPISIAVFQSSPQTIIPKYFDRVLVPFCAYLILRLLPVREEEIKLLHWTAFLMAVFQTGIGFIWMIAPRYSHKHGSQSMVAVRVDRWPIQMCLRLFYSFV